MKGYVILSSSNHALSAPHSTLGSYARRKSRNIEWVLNTHPCSVRHPLLNTLQSNQLRVLLELGLYTQIWLTVHQHSCFTFHKTVVEKCLGTIVPSFPCIWVGPCDFFQPMRSHFQSKTLTKWRTLSIFFFSIHSLQTSKLPWKLCAENISFH